VMRIKENLFGSTSPAVNKKTEITREKEVCCLTDENKVSMTCKKTQPICTVCINFTDVEKYSNANQFFQYVFIFLTMQVTILPCFYLLTKLFETYFRTKKKKNIVKKQKRDYSARCNFI
jgi:hypothetical protein